MSDGGAIAVEQVTDLGQAHPTADMGEIHRDLSRERGPCRAPRLPAQILDTNLEHGGDCRFDRPPDPRGPNPDPGPLSLIRIAFPDCSHCTHRRFSLKIGLNTYHTLGDAGWSGDKSQAAGVEM
jgi:hypothetical protein